MAQRGSGGGVPTWAVAIIVAVAGFALGKGYDLTWEEIRSKASEAEVVDLKDRVSVLEMQDAQFSRALTWIVLNLSRIMQKQGIEPLELPEEFTTVHPAAGNNG